MCYGFLSSGSFATFPARKPKEDGYSLLEVPALGCLSIFMPERRSGFSADILRSAETCSHFLSPDGAPVPDKYHLTYLLKYHDLLKTYAACSPLRSTSLIRYPFPFASGSSPSLARVNDLWTCEDLWMVWLSSLVLLPQ